jgi:hypothetical protein
MPGGAAQWPCTVGLLRTCPSWPALAMVLYGRPRLGAQATSLTQSVCEVRDASFSQLLPLWVHTCTHEGGKLSRCILRELSHCNAPIEHLQELLPC